MPESELLRRQKLFVRLLAQLIVWIYEQGWELTLGEGYRSDGHGHMPLSLHYSKLAQDLNLFVGDRYIVDTDAAEWQAIGAYWKALDPLCAWGGDFSTRDGNHVSVTWQGRE